MSMVVGRMIMVGVIMSFMIVPIMVMSIVIMAFVIMPLMIMRVMVCAGVRRGVGICLTGCDAATERGPHQSTGQRQLVSKFLLLLTHVFHSCRKKLPGCR